MMRNLVARSLLFFWVKAKLIIWSRKVMIVFSDKNIAHRVTNILRQEQEQTIWNFAAKLKSQNSICQFNTYEKTIVLE